MMITRSWMAPSGQMVHQDTLGNISFGCARVDVSSGVRATLESGLFFTPTGELRACVILTIGDVRKVRDNLTGLYVDVRPEDVLIEKPEPE